MRYGSGMSGFIGSHLSKKLDITPIPHEKIQSTRLKPFDTFFFLSSYGNLASQVDDDEIFESNISDLLYVLNQVKKFKFKSFVYLSSSSVKLRTQTTYSRCKKAAEEILLAVMERHNLPICIIRPYSVTGVGEQEEHLIPTLLRCVENGDRISISPDPTHDFIDVEDVVSGIMSLAEHSARGIFELGTGIKTSNTEVMLLVEKITNKFVNVNFADTFTSFRPYDNDNWVSTNFKARGYGWLPSKTLEQSIKEQYDAIKARN